MRETGKLIKRPDSIRVVIEPEELTTFKEASIRSLEHTVLRRMEELREEYNGLVDHFLVNKMILESHIGFDPIIGYVYFLYEGEQGKFLSLIAPEEWEDGPPFLGAYVLNSNDQWEEHNEKEISGNSGGDSVD